MAEKKFCEDVIIIPNKLIDRLESLIGKYILVDNDDGIQVYKFLGYSTTDIVKEKSKGRFKNKVYYNEVRTVVNQVQIQKPTEKEYGRYTTWNNFNYNESFNWERARNNFLLLAPEFKIIIGNMNSSK